MSDEKERATASQGPEAATTNHNNQNESYNTSDLESTHKRAERIAQRRADMPPIHRANYDKAIGGRSLRAATKAFCLMCVCWQKEEVRLCTGLACSLWPYRPYK